MLVKDRLDKALTLVVPTTVVRERGCKDTEKLMRSYGILEQAKDSFLNQEISFEEYIELCAMHEMNVDAYMKTIEQNLVSLKLI